MLATTTCFGA